MGPFNDEDLVGNPYSATDVIDCATQCWNIGEECTYFAFENNGQCWLKKNFVNKVDNVDVTSGMRCEPSIGKVFFLVYFFFCMLVLG